MMSSGYGLISSITGLIDLPDLLHYSMTIIRDAGIIVITKSRRRHRRCSYSTTASRSMRVPSTSTGVAITNPLVLYRSLLATKRIDADPAQHRLAIRLGQLYDELIDYEPIVQYGHKLNQISRALGTTPGTRSAEEDAQIRGTRSRGILSSLWQRNGEQQDSMALTRVLTNHEAAMQIQSPRGLMLHGEVGTGLFTLL